MADLDVLKTAPGRRNFPRNPALTFIMSVNSPILMFNFGLDFDFYGITFNFLLLINFSWFALRPVPMDENPSCCL